jgi:predicted nucleotidyltransferase
VIPVIHHIARRLSQFPSVEAVILFGSRAREDHRERSDIDLAVVCPEATAVEWSRLIEAAEEAPTLLRIDLVRFDAASEELREEILHDGRALYERAENQTIRA